MNRKARREIDRLKEMGVAYDVLEFCEARLQKRKRRKPRTRSMVREEEQWPMTHARHA